MLRHRLLLTVPGPLSSWSVREVTCRCVKDRLEQDCLGESDEAPAGGPMGVTSAPRVRGRGAGHKRLRQAGAAGHTNQLPPEDQPRPMPPSPRNVLFG